MTNEEMEIVMKLIMHGGNAKGFAIQALQEARKFNFEESDKFLELSADELNIAHESQTDLLVQESRGESHEISLLLIHAQDHLMNAITTRDLAIEIIKYIKGERD